MTRGVRQSVSVRRDEILRAAVIVVQRRGLAATRVSDVATELGVSPALVHYHFATKVRLLVEVFGWAEGRALAHLDTAIRAVDGDGPTARLRALVRACVPVGAISPSWRLWIEGWAASLRSPEIAAVSRRLDQRRKAEFAAVLAQGVESGEFSCEDPDGAAARLTALVDGLAVQAMVYGARTQEELATWIGLAAAREAGLPTAALL